MLDVLQAIVAIFLILVVTCVVFGLLAAVVERVTMRRTTEPASEPLTSSASDDKV